MVDNTPYAQIHLPKVGKVEPVIVLSDLSVTEKRKEWERICSMRPDIAELLIDLKADPLVQQLINDFGCKIAVIKSDIE
jgi:hypothetical protein